MIDLVKQFMAKPLNGIITVLCVGVLSTHLQLFEVQKVVAVVQEQQKTDIAMNQQVLDMNESLIRIDENVKFMKERFNQATNKTN